MINKLKVTSWNIKWLNTLISDNITSNKQKRIDAIVKEIFAMDSDIICILEGVKGEEKIDHFCENYLEGKYKPVKASDGVYKIEGRQWIWFLVKAEWYNRCSLLSPDIWDEFSAKTWKVNYWGDFKTEKHDHYRHPQVLIFDWDGLRVEFIGLHTKSKYVQSGEDKWKEGEGSPERKKFIKEAIKARIKLTTEVANVRAYIDTKFEQVSNPAIFVMGDLNDGPGKEFFERQYLFFDLLSNLQGDVFSAKRFLNHALFDFDDELRWSCIFEDFVDPNRNPKILLDHILFTQGLVNGTLPIIVNAKSGYIEHEVHDLINASNPKYATTSDHKPVSLIINKN